MFVLIYDNFLFEGGIIILTLSNPTCTYGWPLYCYLQIFLFCIGEIQNGCIIYTNTRLVWKCYKSLFFLKTMNFWRESCLEFFLLTCQFLQYFQDLLFQIYYPRPVESDQLLVTKCILNLHFIFWDLYA